MVSKQATSWLKQDPLNWPSVTWVQLSLQRWKLTKDSETSPFQGGWQTRYCDANELMNHCFKYRLMNIIYFFFNQFLKRLLKLCYGNFAVFIVMFLLLTHQCARLSRKDLVLAFCGLERISLKRPKYSFRWIPAVTTGLFWYVLVPNAFPKWRTKTHTCVQRLLSISPFLFPINTWHAIKPKNGPAAVIKEILRRKIPHPLIPILYYSTYISLVQVAAGN